jgi:hypothetical protein
MPTFRYAVPDQWEPSNNVRVYRVPNHTIFSRSVTQTFLRATEEVEKDNGIPLLLAVCAYPPSFFYTMIREEVKKLVGRDPSFSDNDLASLKDFEDHCEADSLLDQEERYPAAKSSFLKGTQKVFPHFIAFHEHKEAVFRLCCFGPGMSRFHTGMCNADHHEEYLKCFKRYDPFHASYAFFRWLNGPNTCLVVPPHSWEEWGLAEPWDFAIFKARALIEYHPLRKMCLHVEPLEDVWSWPFVSTPMLLSRVAAAKSDGNWTGLWRDQAFLEIVYGDSNKLGALKRKVFGYLTQLEKTEMKRFPNDPEVVAMITVVGNLRKSLAQKADVQKLANLSCDLRHGLTKYTDKKDRDALHNSLRAFLANR